MSKQARNTFKLSDEELACREMVLIAFTMLESRGYKGFTELLSIINDPEIILKIIRLLYGLEIKIPPLKEFISCLQAAEYTFCDMHKRVNSYLPAKPQDIRQFMNIDKEKEAELLDIFDKWAKYMYEQGYDLTQLMHMNRNNTKKRIKMAISGKKWTSSRY